jgi:hypothetical protein
MFLVLGSWFLVLDSWFFFLHLFAKFKSILHMFGGGVFSPENIA